VIQLVVIEHTKKGGITFDGYFNFSNNRQCHSLCFLSESILIAVFNKKEIQVLYTSKFIPGKFVEDKSERTTSMNRSMSIYSSGSEKNIDEETEDD